MDNANGKARKFGAFVGFVAPACLFVGPILMAAEWAGFLGLAGSVLLGLGLVDMSIHRR